MPHFRASGLPFTFVRIVEDVDDRGNLTPQRIFPRFGVKNDQRNDAQLTINGRIEKRLQIGRTHIAAFLEIENLLNSDDLTLTQVDRDQRDFLLGDRRFGRRFEIGASIFF